MSVLRWVIPLAVLVTGCASKSADDNGDVASTYESELKVTSASYLGSISNGDTKTSTYSDPPKYRAYGFHAKGGDKITIDVTSPDGDAMAWLTDETYATTYASNDDASSKTLDSHIEYTVPSDRASQAYRIVFRDYDRLDATFYVTLGIESDDSTDGGSDDCDPASEPDKDYLYTPAQCAVVRYTCPSGWKSFQNACGCGCE